MKEIGMDEHLKLVDAGDRVDLIKIAGEPFIVSEVIRTTDKDIILRFPAMAVPYAQPEGQLRVAIGDWVPDMLVANWVDVFKCYAMPRITILFQRPASDKIREDYVSYRKKLLEQIKKDE